MFQSLAELKPFMLTTILIKPFIHHSAHLVKLSGCFLAGVLRCVGYGRQPTVVPPVGQYGHYAGGRRPLGPQWRLPPPRRGPPRLGLHQVKSEL